jgi:hypothetical protein
MKACGSHRRWRWGITDHIWTVGELIDTAVAEPMEQQAA